MTASRPRHREPRKERRVTRSAFRYLASRLVTTVLIVLGAMLLLFALPSFVPGDPATQLLGPQATPEYAARFIHDMGLDQPAPVRLMRFLGNLASGDLGIDVLSGRSVNSMVWSALPSTFVLTFAAMGLAIVTGVPLGIFAATHRGSVMDHVLAFISVAFIAVPSFVIAIFLLLIFSIWLDWLPVLGTGRDGDLWDQLRRLILPTISLSLGWVGYVARLVRSSMLEVLGENYIRTSRAYGLPERLITYKYALKNACIPTIAVLGLGTGRLLGGAVLVEIVFARPGLGRLIFDAVTYRNYPVVQGAVLVVVIVFVVVNLIVDLSYSAIDPRIRAGAAGGGLPR
jgi:peptide/nickel transport system permease protein